jgi:maltose alpha-D-glucosyltransferase/alpha-amylase
MAGIDRNDPLWYKDAVFYSVYVRTFADSDGDGVGDFPGLTQKLDYLEWLGVTAIWVLPMYPSPLKDGGYDIADYYGILPAYGGLEDFKRFLDAAHDRGIRVITDLVINHTSDQHPWFVESRSSRSSPKRDWYVWSDTDQRYQGVRIIFSDTEPSNWTWDEATQQYYWHRFYRHQPDLNFDNPEVQEAILQVASFWANLGVDGFRVDAAPYLYEREGTTCDNLPETHTYIKRLRAHLDVHHPGTLLLAEANLWPEQLIDYFGTGDEFQMAYHFPVMPRLYLSLAQGDAHSIVDILRRTPPIPPSCQWGVFLRNHDELTLEMVTESEREAMYEAYAPDRRLRLNLGIRRRLAPMMRDNAAKILLLNAIMLSLNGTPFLYYGDEIGMGDLPFLNDRDGVRTPMQWSPDRNGGFSTADAYHLPFPVIDDPVFGYRRVNVEDERRNRDSLLQQMRHLLQARQRDAHLFGRGSLELLTTDHPSVLAFLRRHERAAMLAVANVAAYSRTVHLDLAAFAGETPIDVVHGAVLDPITGNGTTLFLPPYGFLWLRLAA